MSDIDEFLNKCWAITVDNLGHLPLGSDIFQTFYVQLPDDCVHVLVAPWNGEDEKFHILNVVRQHLAEHKAARYTLVSEAWMSARPIDEPEEDRPLPSKDPNRIEVVMAIAVDRDGSIRFRQGTLVRSDNGTRLVEDIKDIDNFKGLMTRLFEPNNEPPHPGTHKIKLWGEGEEKGTLH